MIPVDLFGQPADHDRIAPIAEAENLFVLDDAAQAFGATYQEPPPRHARAGNRDELLSRQAARLLWRRRRGAHRRRGACASDAQPARSRGGTRDKYDNVRIGINGRLDTIQAAVLIEKLKIFPEEILARERIARRYSAGLADVATVPKLAQGSTSVWAQYTIRLAPGRRDGFAAALKPQGIPTAIYYPIPLHRQEPYQHFPGRRGRRAGERAAGRGGDQPAHARLSRRGDPGPDHRGGAARAGWVSGARISIRHAIWLALAASAPPPDL